MEWTPEKIADYLNRLPQVEWDRSISAPVAETDVMTIVYGWIARDDGHFDFVQLEFASWSPEPGFSTSSAEHSSEMNRAIYGVGATHYPCVRVADIPALAVLVKRLVPWTAAVE
jgi:hypothetical protein